MAPILCQVDNGYSSYSSFLSIALRIILFNLFVKGHFSKVLDKQLQALL